jgi:glucose-6-phosphate isomerase
MDSESWKRLQEHFETVGKDFNMKALFDSDPLRFAQFSAEFNPSKETVPTILLDYSKNLITQETKDLLLNLAKESQVELWRDRMFSGDKINTTEGYTYLFILISSILC